MRPGEVGNAPVAPRQVRQNLPARGIGQRGKSSVQRSRRIFNHLVNYLAESLRRANIFLQFVEASISACGSPDYRFSRESTTCESIRFASTTDRARASAFHFNVEAFVSNALSFRRLAQAPLQQRL